MALSPEEQLAEAVSEFYDDPLGYVMFMFPWDSDVSIQLVELAPKYRERFNSIYGPDKWACEFLDELGAEIKDRGFDGRTAVTPIQFSTASGHGIGKSVLVAWLIKFILDTRPFAKGVVTAGTAEQLKTKTWAELGKWHRISLTEHWFDYNTGRGAMSLAHKEYKESWRCDAQTCKEENSESFAGLHSANSTPFFIFDEASAVPDKIYEVREGGTTDGEPMTFDFGNPTKNSGMFFENCMGRFRHRYKLRRIDSRDVQITNKERIDAWIQDYGADSDFVKVRVKGEFPSAGSLQFIPTESVDEAMQREPVEDRAAPLLIGVDVARFGDDDTVLYPRIGDDARTWKAERYKGLDTVQTTGRVIEMIRRFRALGRQVDGLFVDGGGIGGGVVDQLLHLGYNPIEVQFGSSPTDKTTYRYRGDEMWGRMREALRSRLVLPITTEPNGVDLREQLTQREFGYTEAGNKIHLEPKKDMKARLSGDHSSPDIADALALTFAERVSPTAILDKLFSTPRSTIHEYNPLETSW